MKKSRIAAVFAAAALAGAANAGYFNVTGASFVNGGSSTISGSGFTGGAGQMVNSSTYLLDAGQATGGTPTDITALDANSEADIDGALGSATAGVITLQYFTFDGTGSSAGLGFFGFRLVNNSASAFNFNFTADSASPVANFGTMGMLNTGDVGGYNSGTGQMAATTSVSAGNSFYAVFGGLIAGQSIDINVARNVSEAATFNIEYFSFTGGVTANVIGSGSGAQSSSLSFATYAVPVPAPALLAGAGLVGAAALRRRMAKKA